MDQKPTHSDKIVALADHKRGVHNPIFAHQPADQEFRP
jgi:hypothetical protein